MKLQTISCSLTPMAGMSWLHYSFTKAAPWSPLNWQVGGLNLRLIWKKKPVLVTSHSVTIFNLLGTLGCHLFSQTWHSHHPLAPALLRHPWAKWTPHRMDISCTSASVFSVKHFLHAKAGFDMIRFTNLQQWHFNSSTVQVLSSYSITNSHCTYTDSIISNISQIRVV